MAISVIARGQFTLKESQDGYWGRIDPSIYQVVCDEDGNPIVGELGAGGKATFRVSASCGDDPLEMVQGTGTALQGQCKWYISSMQSGCTAAPITGSPDTFYLQSITSDNAGVAVIFNFEGKETQTYTVQITKNRKGEAGGDGVGVESLVNWYAVSASATAAPTSGWSQTPQAMSADKRYLWNYEVVNYSDGHSVKTDPRVIGVYGEKGDPGEDGLTAQYVYFFSGYKVSPGCEISVTGGANIAPQNRGFNCVTLDRQTLAVREQMWFDTYSDRTGEHVVENMKAWIDSVDETVFLCIATYDYVNWSPTSGDNLEAALRPFGLERLPHKLTGYWPFCFMGYRGLEPGYAAMAQTPETTTITELQRTMEMVVYTAGGAISTQRVPAGILSVENQYAISESATTAPSTGWSTTPPQLTPTKRYLWNYEIIRYTDSTSEETERRVIGVYGDTGSAGKGIKSITEYYLATSIDTGITTSTAGWTTTVQSTTTEERFLWNYEVVLYTDDTSYTSEPRIIGTHGEKGESGAIAKNLSGLVTDLDVMRTQQWEGRWYAGGGNGIAHRPAGVNAFGLDVSRTADGWWSQVLTPSDALTNTQWMRAYGNGAWTAWIEKGKDGTNGTPGTPGEDGRTPYVHFAYANSADGKSGFSTTESEGKLYIGQYVDYNEADSTNPELYSWTKIKGDDGESAQYIYVRGVNYEQLTLTDGFIEVNGTRIIADNAKVGLNLITLNKDTLEVVFSSGYQYNVAANGDALAEKLNSLDSSVFVCIYGRDSIGSLFTENLVAALTRLGSPSINMDRVNGRYAFAFLGQVGLEPGYAFLSQPPRQEGDVANGPLAEVSAYVVNGAIAYNYTPEDGVGIANFQEFYLATAQNSGVTTSTPGWTTTPQETTKDKPYLWNYEIITYTDESNYTSTPRIIGVRGEDALTMVIDGVIVLPAVGGTTTLKARLFQSGEEVDAAGKEFIYTWESYDANGQLIEEKVGKTTVWTLLEGSDRVEVRCKATEIGGGSETGVTSNLQYNNGQNILFKDNSDVLIYT